MIGSIGSLIGVSIVTLIFGFFTAAVVQSVLHGVVRFRSEWNTTFIACTLIAFVCELAFLTCLVSFDAGSSGHMARVICTTALISLISGVLACRLVIRSKSGRKLPTLGAVFLSSALVAPAMFCGLVLYFFTEMS